MREMSASVPLTLEQREPLMTRCMAVIAKGGYEGITPFIDDARELPPDLTKPAPANRWRFAGWDRLYGLYRAAYHLKDDAPQSLRTLKAAMLVAVDGSPEAQAQAVALYGNRIAEVFRDVRACGAEPDRVDAALGDLAGLTLRLALRQGSVPDEVVLTATLRARDYASAEGQVAFTGGSEVAPYAVSIAAQGQAVVECAVRVDPASLPATPTAAATLVSNGEAFTAKASRSVGASITRWYVIGPFDNPGGSADDVKHPVEMEPLNLWGTYPGQGGEVAWRPVERDPALPVAAEHVVDFAALFGARANAAAYALAALESDRDQQALLTIGSDDGVIAWLNGEEVHRNLVGRAYSRSQDRARVHLMPGQNTLLLKITQGIGDWKFSAEVLGMDGNAAPGVRCATW
jgi:hypothetical protein